MFCWGSEVTNQYDDFLGRKRFEAIETVNHSCPHSEPHWYQCFDETLRRLHPELQLGFDRVRRRFVIFRFSPAPLRVERGLSQLYRFIDIVLECKAMELYEEMGARRYKIVGRPPAGWVFHELAGSHSSRFEPGGNWGADTATKMALAAEADREKRIADLADAAVSDAMSIADQGNPSRVRTAVLFPSKADAA